MYLWDWRTGYNFQRVQAAVQPGSIDSEAGIFALMFDKSGSRLFSCEADKTIKVYKEDETAVSGFNIPYVFLFVVLKCIEFCYILIGWRLSHT